MTNFFLPFMAIQQTRRKLIIFVVSSFLITVIIYTLRLSRTQTPQAPLPTQTNEPPKKPPSRFFQVNNVTLDFAHASKNFEDKFMQYIRNASLETALSYHLYSHFNPNNNTISPNITQLDTHHSSADILVVNSGVNEEILANTSSYLIFESSDFLNFTFQFVDNHRHFHLQLPIILLRRAGPDYEEVLSKLWNLQNPENCTAVVRKYSFYRHCKIFERIRDSGCGLGCAIHWIHHGFHAAYRLDRYTRKGPLNLY